MARPLRIEYPGAVYHVTSRGNAGELIYKDDQDRRKFLEILAKAKKKYNTLCHTYCIMDNHYHLLLETLDGRLSLLLRQINGVYTQYFNRRYNRRGHLFQGRYKGILIQKDSHLLEVCRYTVLNPVRAGMVKSTELWKWSSYSALAGLYKASECLDKDWIIGCFGKTKKKAEKSYRQFVLDGIGKESIWSDLIGQCLFGTEEFVAEMVDYAKGYKEIPEISKEQKFLNRPKLEKLFTKAIRGDIKKRNKLIILAVYEYGYKQKEVADFLGLYFTSISRIINEVKKA